MCYDSEQVVLGRGVISDHQFGFQVRETESALIVDVAGHIDGLNAEDFQAGLNEKVRAYSGDAIILDLATLTYISSAGLRAILVTAKILHAKGKKFSICSLSETVGSMVKTAGFDKVIDVYGSSSDAVSAVTS